MIALALWIRILIFIGLFILSLFIVFILPSIIGDHEYIEDHLWGKIGIGILLIGISAAFCFWSYSNDRRLVKKFIGRQNARELNAASKYIYPADHASLYFFNEEVYSRTPNLLLKLLSKENITVNGQKGVVVKIECINVSQFFINYMQNLNKLDKKNCIVDTIYIKDTRDGKKITFSWATIKGENLFLAHIGENAHLKELNIYIKIGMNENTDNAVTDDVQKTVYKKGGGIKRRKNFDEDEIIYIEKVTHIEKQKEPILKKQDETEKRDSINENDSIDEMESIISENVSVETMQDSTDEDINIEDISVEMNSENMENEEITPTTNSISVPQGNIIGKLTKNKKIVIDAYSEDPDWVQCFTIDHTCRIVKGYIKKDDALVKNSLFFSLGIFEGLSLLIALIILVVIAFPIIYIGSIVDALFGRGVGGIVFCVAMILGLIATAYMLLENILYELFLINLPF